MLINHFSVAVTITVNLFVIFQLTNNKDSTLCLKKNSHFVFVRISPNIHQFKKKS